jgi:hypothetical protein
MYDSRRNINGNHLKHCVFSNKRKYDHDLQPNNKYNHPQYDHDLQPNNKYNHHQEYLVPKHRLNNLDCKLEEGEVYVKDTNKSTNDISSEHSYDPSEDTDNIDIPLICQSDDEN